MTANEQKPGSGVLYRTDMLQYTVLVHVNNNKQVENAFMYI